MNASDKRNEIVSAWRAVAPVDYNTALSIANQILKDYPKESKQFREWFEINGVAAIAGVNNA